MKPHGTLIGRLKASRNRVTSADADACGLLGLDPAEAVGADISWLALPCCGDGGAPAHSHACDFRAIRKVGPEPGRTIVASCRSDGGKAGGKRVCEITVLDASDPADIIHRIILAKHEVEEIFDSSPQLSLYCDSDFRVVRANRAFAKETGARFSELIGKAASAALEKLGGAQALALAAHALDSDMTVADEFRADSRIFVMEAMPIHRSHDESLVLLRFSDVTRERALEAKLVHWDRLRHLGELAAGIAHEAVTPVSYIAWNLERLERFAAEVAEGAQGDLAVKAAEARELAGDSLGGVADLKKMLKDLRAFSHPGDKLAELSSLEECMERAIALSGAKFKDGVELSRRYAPSPVRFALHPHRIAQVFVNLIRNAIDAMEGRGTLTVSTGYSADGKAWAQVADTGKGIPEEDVGRVFDTFFTTKSSAGGTGLGLALSNMIVAAHGGSIAVTSRCGEGTVFRVTLPLTPDEADR